MKETKTPTENTLPYRFPVWIASLIVYCLLSIGGILLSPYIPKGALLWHISLGLWLVLAGTGYLCLRILRKKLSSMSVQEALDYSEGRRQEMLRNAQAEKRKLQHIAVLCKAFWLTLFLLSISLCFFSSYLSAAVSALSLLLLSGHIARFLRKKPSNDEEHAIKREDFPLLYALAEEAAGPLCKKPIFIYPGMPDGGDAANASIGKDEKGIRIILGPVLTDILSREELLEILRHEFAHIRQNHVEELADIQNLLTFLSDCNRRSFFTIATDWALSFPLSYLALRSTYYFTLSSRIKESEADSDAAEQADPSATASALAKTHAFSLFWFEESGQFIFGKTEEVPEHWTSDLIRVFRDTFPHRISFWQDLMMKEIPARVDSHPTFRQRWETLGRPTYTMELPTHEDPLGAECRAFVALCDRNVHETDLDTYKECRRESYLQHKQTIKELAPREDELNPDELRPLIHAYNQLGMNEASEALCDKILRNSTEFSGAFARYWKGVHLLRRHDKEGISHIYQALETNRNYIEPGLEQIGSACFRLGLEEELKEYRERYATLMQHAEDHTVGGITAKADLSPETLPEGWLDQILEKILSAGKEHLEQIYLVHETVNESYSTSSFVLRYKTDTTEEEQNMIYDEIFRYLDDYPTGWDFALYDYEPSMEKPLAKVPGSCVYKA